MIADAVVAKVQAALPGRLVADGQVVVDPPPKGHVVVYCSGGDEDQQTISGDPDRMVFLYIHSFGPDRWAAQWLSGKAVAALTSEPFVAEGWQPTRWMGHHQNPPSSDTDVPGRPVVMVVDQLQAPFTKSA